MNGFEDVRLSRRVWSDEDREIFNIRELVLVVRAEIVERYFGYAKNGRLSEQARESQTWAA